MIWGTGHGHRLAVASATLVSAFALALPVPALAVPPHVATTPSTDSCAMCHRAHTATASFGSIETSSWEMTGTALAITVPTLMGDVPLCYTCHGIDALGSGTAVAASFELTSAHSLAPEPSLFGPKVKYCSSCHDSHGADKTMTGDPYPSLLRARTADGSMVFTAPEYCATCHDAEPEASRLDGVDVYKLTSHYTALPDPAAGAQVRCLVCHESHGSEIAPLIVSQIATPAASAVTTVTANDRTLCLICHESTRGTYRGETLYATSGHGASAVETTIVGEWAAEGAKRRVGECQTCHAPMGRDSGDGTPIPTLLELEGSALCLSCHTTGGVASTPLDTTLYPAAAAAHLELVAAFSPETTTATFATVGVWGSDASDSAPRAIIGPRLYDTPGALGALAVGDIDGIPGAEVLVADPTAESVTIFVADPLKGISSWADGLSSVDLPPGVTGDFIAVGDVLTGGGNEIVALDANDGMIRVLRFVRDGSGAHFVTVGSAFFTSAPVSGQEITGLALGDVTEDGFADVVVTESDETTGLIEVFREWPAGSGEIDPVAGIYAGIHTLPGTRGPSIGDIDGRDGIEIAVADADGVSVYSAIGNVYGHYALDAEPGARALETHIGNVLPGITPAATSGNELAVAIDASEATSCVNVFVQTPGLGLDATPQRYDTGVGYRTGSVASGDIDGDGYTELVAGSGGTWSRDASSAVAPSVRVYQHTPARDAFATPTTLRAGGVERAGIAPALALADLGAVGPSRHPVGAVESAHVATESASFTRHVECADCHNAHEATSTVGIAPDVYGRILGTWGTALTSTGAGSSATYADAEPVAAEYQLCLKCHSAYLDADGLEGAADIGAEVNPGNESVHAVTGSVTTSVPADSFVSATPAWTSSTVLYCTDCHTVAGVAPAIAGPHTSREAPILKSPYLGTVPSDLAMLCYDCHKYSVYYTSAEDTGTAASWFADADAGPLHALHVRDGGFGCQTCHASHGAETNDRLIRDAISFSIEPTGGACIGPCHPSPNGTDPGVVYER